MKKEEKEIKFIEFVKVFEKKYQYLIKHADCKFKYDINYNHSFPFTIHCSKINNSEIKLIQSNYGDNYLISSGILENTYLVSITITE